MTTPDKQAPFGVIGLGVMGRNLALNIEDHGTPIAVWNRSPERTEAFVAGNPGRRTTAARTLAELVATIPRPRRILLMVSAGKPVDLTLEALRPLLEEGDIVVDGGNSWFKDTRRREADYRAAGLNFVGMGVSGGEAGARFGPSIMPGGTADAYRALAPVLEAIAAKTESGACVTHVGPDGAGHFVKMVHNGIEYADMQLIAEAYDVLRRVGGLTPPELAEVFDGYNRGPLGSFLIEITAAIFRTRDERTGDALVDRVLDKAGQKGTGKWTAQIALDLGVSVPSIAAALDARIVSSIKDQRVRAAEPLAVVTTPSPIDRTTLIEKVERAMHAAKIGAYAQGMSLIAAASAEYGWGIDLSEMARIWKGGCIIRAKLLDPIMAAFKDDPGLVNLMLAGAFAEAIRATHADWREVVALAVRSGVPVPATSGGLAYFDAYRSARLPQNLTQAQRDAFGAHTYQRTDDPQGPFVHFDWLGKK